MRFQRRFYVGCIPQAVCPGVQLPALERWTTLERLVLDQCGLLTHLSLSLPRLRTVSLRHCRALANVTPYFRDFSVVHPSGLLSSAGRLPAWFP